jgi:hypothetical protein
MLGYAMNSADGKLVYNSTQRTYVETFMVARLPVCVQESFAEEGIIVP